MFLFMLADIGFEFNSVCRREGRARWGHSNTMIHYHDEVDVDDDNDGRTRKDKINTCR